MFSKEPLVWADYQLQLSSWLTLASLESSFLDAGSRWAGRREESLPTQDLRARARAGPGPGRGERKEGQRHARGCPTSRTLSPLESDGRGLASGAVMAVC